jgi:hypothetical protein
MLENEESYVEEMARNDHFKFSDLKTLDLVFFFLMLVFLITGTA